MGRGEEVKNVPRVALVKASFFATLTGSHLDTFCLHTIHIIGTFFDTFGVTRGIKWRIQNGWNMFQIERKVMKSSEWSFLEWTWRRRRWMERYSKFCHSFVGTVINFVSRNKKGMDIEWSHVHNGNVSNVTWTSFGHIFLNFHQMYNKERTLDQVWYFLFYSDNCKKDGKLREWS